MRINNMRVEVVRDHVPVVGVAVTAVPEKAVAKKAMWLEVM